MTVYQAIQTKFLPATNRRGSRIKAMCDARIIIIPCDDRLSVPGNHIEAVKELCRRMLKEAPHGIWHLPLISGQLKGGSYAHVFKE